MGAEDSLGTGGGSIGGTGGLVTVGGLLGPASGSIGGPGDLLGPAGGVLTGQHTLRYCPYPNPQVSPAVLQSLRFLRTKQRRIGTQLQPGGA